jgi:ketosteroid isomerase-like protein
MQSAIGLTIFLLSSGLGAPLTARAQGTAAAVDDSLLRELVALERSALDRWITLDPQGYLDLYAQEVTYFDPTTERRVDGLKGLQERLTPMRNVKLPFKNLRYEMVDPRVQRHGDVALLTFNVINYGTLPDRPESVVSRWNSTEVYRRIDGKWRIVHSHWSFTKPEVKQPGL